MVFGQGKRQKKIIELGKKNQLTFGDFIELFGYKESLVQLNKLEELGLIVLDEKTFENNEITDDTRVIWLKK